MKVIKPLPEHLTDWIHLVEEFLKEGIDEYNFGYKKEDAETTFFLWIARQPAFLLEHGGEIIGVLAGSVGTHFFNYAGTYFQEAMWYVLPKYRHTSGGLKLLRAMEQECKRRGITKMVMAHTYSLMPRHFQKLYKGLGYKRIETKYIKDI